VEVSEMGCQAGQSVMGCGGGGGMPEDGHGSGNELTARSKILPNTASTSLCEIRFARKDVSAMNVLMCRKVLSAIYQCKAEVNAIDTGKTRQGLPDFVPDQFAVIYGIKSIAIAKLNEFLYGVRECRFRKTAKGEDEDEPLLYFFWRASHHGVPLAERLPIEDFEFYIDLLAMVAKTCSEEHTLNLKGGAFWNLLGSMVEIQVPAFVLLNTLHRHFGPKPAEEGSASTKGHPGHPELLERLRRATQTAAAAFQKLSRDKRKAPQPSPSYKPQVLGADNLDPRGHLPLEAFLQLAMEGAAAQRARDGQTQQAIFDTWERNTSGEKGYHCFVDMMEAAGPDLPESVLLDLYRRATSGNDPDKVQMVLIVDQLRKMGITLKRPAGVNSFGDGVGTSEDVQLAVTAIKLFGSPANKGGLQIGDGIVANMTKWQKVGLEAGKARAILRSILDGSDVSVGETAIADT